MGLGKGHRHDLSGVPTVVTENVEDYRKAIPVYLTKDDVVLECGAAQGVTTNLIAEVAADVVGIDLSTFQTEGAQRRHPNVCFYNMDAYDGSAIRKLGKQFTVIFIDVSGNRGVGDVVKLMDQFEALFKPRLFVVKCYKLKKLMGMCKVFPDDFREGQQLFTGNQHDKLTTGPDAKVQQLASHALACSEDDAEDDQLGPQAPAQQQSNQQLQ